MSEAPTVLARLREENRWSREQLAARLEAKGRELGLPVPSRESLKTAIKRHETGRSRVTDAMYFQLYCAVFGASRHELFGELDGNPDGQIGSSTVVCHRFTPVYVGPEQVAAAARQVDHVDAGLVDAPQAWRAEIEHPRGSCTLYGLPWGVLVYHLATEATSDSITDLAVQRRQAHRGEPKWAAAHLATILEEPATPAYVLSAFWVTEPHWHGPELDVAMRLLCRPRTLLQDGEDDAVIEHARLVEAELLRTGFDDPEQIAFGIPGASIGYATWSGVSYFPLSAERALAPERFVEFEVVAQGLWAWCAHIRDQVGEGRDPVLAENYGRRWLRGMKMRLTTPRPLETGQQKLMREAIMASSGLAGDLLPSVLDILRDCQPE